MTPVTKYPLPEKCFVDLMLDEGYDVVTNDKHDSGGLTKFGISQKAYPHLDIRKLTVDDAYQLYQSDYWQKPLIDQLPRGIDYAVFDFGVNSGVKRAVKALQRQCGIPEAYCDGIIGQDTLDAVRMKVRLVGKDLFLATYCDNRATWLKSLKQPRFERGWLARVTRVLIRSIERTKT